MHTITRAGIIRHLIMSSTVNELTNCWEWNASRTNAGYGQLSNTKIIEFCNAKGAHRASKIVFDDWTPEGHREQTRHLCHNPACINPDHLATGSASENAQDRIKAGRPSNVPCGENSPQSKLTEIQVREIRARREDGETQRSLAESFGVSRFTISMIVRRKYWKHIN